MKNWKLPLIIAGTIVTVAIGQLLENFTSHAGNFLFWIIWIILTIASVYGFCYLDNFWLED